MGWLWGSPAPSGNTEQPAETQKSDAQSSVALSEEQRLRIFGKPSPAQAQQTSSSRDAQADAELEEWIKAFESSSTAGGQAKIAQQALDKTALPAQDRSEPPPQSRILPNGQLDISPSAIHPRTMSCRAQFDQAFYCQSLGGKFNDIYRYGSLRDCSEQWGAFWFCMRTRTLPDHEKEKRIQEYYKDREEKRKKEKGSSEDVWEIRTTAVERAFWKDPDLDDGSVQVKE